MGTEITVNGNKYTIPPISLIEWFRFFHGYAQAETGSDRDVAFGMQAIAFCINSEGKPLASESVLNDWFGRHPADLLPLERKAMTCLIVPMAAEHECYWKDRQKIMRGIRSGGTQTVPKEWAVTSFFSRIVLAGMCQYRELKDGTLSIQDVFDMHRMLDLQESMRLKAMEKAKSKAPALGRSTL